MNIMETLNYHIIKAVFTLSNRQQFTIENSASYANWSMSSISRDVSQGGFSCHFFVLFRLFFLALFLLYLT